MKTSNVIIYMVDNFVITNIMKRIIIKSLHYNDVVIKDETSLDYELIIKGRKAEIGSELWYKDEEWIENIFITGIFISNKTRRINYKSKNRTGVIDVETMGDSLFWEKPTSINLPDTDGNLSEG